MSDFKDKDLAEVEEKLKEQLNAIQLEPFEEMMAEIRPKLKKKRKWSFKSKAFMTRAVAVAASIVLLLGVGLTAYFMWPQGEVSPVYRYEDLDIELKACEKTEITNRADIYLPDLDILLNTSFYVGRHKETLEAVYYLIEGYHVDGDIARRITLTIIFQKKYNAKNEEVYNTNNIISVSNKEISVLEDEYDMPFYTYKLGFKVGDIRYYMSYQTTFETNDIESFMQLFLK